MSSMITNHIFTYKPNAFRELVHLAEAPCEEICIQVSREIGILPLSRLLFGLRICDTTNWLAPCDPLKAAVTYEFRMRFKVPQLVALKKLDETAYDYFYHQVRHDLVQGRIDEIKYPAFKDNVLGLGVVDMYIDMMELKYSIEDLEKNYRKYIPKQLLKNHPFFAKKKISKSLRDIKKKDHDLFYVKGTYLDEINRMAPNYLIEKFEANSRYLEEDDLGEGTCPVTILINPFVETESGLRVFYKYKNEWKHIAKLENIYALYQEGHYNVRLELSDMPNGYRLGFQTSAEQKSFISYVAGYYRLCVKWMSDLCVQFATPSLQELKTIRCHGPIGGEFSYSKIREKSDKCGSYIVRQSEKEYDTYYLDINTRGTHTETFKVTKECNKWLLHIHDCVRSFEKLVDLAKSIETASEDKIRIPPSEYDKPPLLLICIPRNQLTIKKTVSELSEAELQRKRVQIIDPKIDLQWYRDTQKDCEGGLMTEMRADWILPNSDKNLIVTLKIQKSDKHINEFMNLANSWSKMYSSEFMKLYGLTLSTPHTMVMEFSKFGPLNAFLAKLGNRVPLACLLEAFHGLVRAVVYLQENSIIHGNIRCSKLQVTKFDPEATTLVAKLADPGLSRQYKEEDFAWLPFEYHRCMEGAKSDPKAELWAFATTTWEIFSRGQPVNKLTPDELRKNYGHHGGILPPPSTDCPQDMYITMMDGWNSDPDKRFNQQLIFSRLIAIKENHLCSNYAELEQNMELSDRSSMLSGSSILTRNTLIHGSNSTCSQSGYSPCDESAPLIPICSLNYNSDSQSMYPSYSIINSVVQFPDGCGKVVIKEKIGEGHYGTVYRGEWQYYNTPRQVAVKTFKSLPVSTALNNDFQREIKIMKALDHRNIVKILTAVSIPQISIIMEYVECGSFIVYLSSQKPNLTNEKLLRFALDIGEGMDYLRSKNVIHRDLAARNILVDSDCVKISDFGLAQIADSNGYYFVQSERDIPIRWYSPETIKTNKYSFQSDVWSYGVTLFEMFSRGEAPNLDPDNDLSQTEILDRLERGDRLRKPTLCPEIVYDMLMRPCWAANPKSRPDFSEILRVTRTVLNESGECI